MYDTRTYTLGAIAGVSPEIVNIFTSRIPEDIKTVSKSGKERHHNGDKIVLSVLDRLYDLKGFFSVNRLELQNLTYIYQISQDKKFISFERFVLLKTLRTLFPTEKTSSAGKYVRFPKNIDLSQISEDEIHALYEWIY